MFDEMACQERHGCFSCFIMVTTYKDIFFTVFILVFVFGLNTCKVIACMMLVTVACIVIFVFVFNVYYYF